MSQSLSSTPPLSAGGHARAMLVLGLPLIGAHLAQIALHVTDTVIMGWYGVTELAALVLASTTFFTLFHFGAGFSQAVMPMVAASLGRGDEAQVRRDTRMGLWLSIAFSIVIYPLFWWSEPVLLALGQKPDVSALAQEYLRIAGLGMAPALLVRVFTGLLAALERTRVVLAVTLLAVVVNGLLNWMLVFGNWGAPEMGVAGSAIATVSCQIVTALVLALYAARNPALERFRLFQRFWRADPGALGQVFRLGLPIGLTSIAEGGLFQASVLMMGMVGKIELAAHGIAMQVTSITFMVHVGLSSAATVRTGRAFGSGDAAALRLGAKVALALSVGFSFATILTILSFPTGIVSLFVDRADPDVALIMTVGAMLLAFGAAFQLADGMQVMALGLLRGVQDTQVPMLMAWFSYWVVGVPAGYALGFWAGYGAAGIWSGLVIGLTLAAALLLWRFWQRAPEAEACPAGEEALGS